MTEISEQEEVDSLLEWRLDLLVQAGYNKRNAKRLANLLYDVDLHTATELLSKGCSEATAMRILL